MIFSVIMGSSRGLSVIVVRLNSHNTAVRGPHFDFVPSGGCLDLDLEQNVAGLALLGCAESGASGRLCRDRHGLLLRNGRRRGDPQPGGELRIWGIEPDRLTGAGAAVAGG